MGFYRQGNLAEMVRLASERVITYNECARMLEDALQQKYPWARLLIMLPELKAYCSGPVHYCHELLKVEKNIHDTIEERCVG